MPDLSDLLDRTTPHDLPPVDVGAIARTARRRSRRRTGTALAAAVTLAVLGGAIGVSIAGHDHPQVVVADQPAGPDRTSIRDGMGTWHRLPDAPYGGLSAATALSDGRVLAWGDGRRLFGDTGDRGDADLEVALLDKAATRWDAVAVPPSIRGLNETTVQMLFGGGRLLLVGMGGDGVYRGAVFAPASGTWTLVPHLEDSKVDLGAVSWDGRTLVVVRTDLGSNGPVAAGGPHDPADPASGVITLDGRISAPLTRRWALGDPTWTKGTPPPLSARHSTGVASDGHHLVIIGGTTGEMRTAVPALTRSDGAIYDIDRDTWTALPDLPWRASQPGVGWVDGRLVVAGGYHSDSEDDGAVEQGGVAYTASDVSVAELSEDGVRWEMLPSAPVPRGIVSVQPLGSGSIVTSAQETNRPGVGQSALIGGRWEHAPRGTFLDWKGVPVTIGGRAGTDVHVRRGPEDWVSAAKAPFGDRMDSATALAGGRLYVIGGESGKGWTPDASAWVLKLLH